MTVTTIQQYGSDPYSNQISNVNISSSSLSTVYPLNTQIYSGAVSTGDPAIQIIDNLQDYNDFTFFTSGITASETINIMLSLDGVTFLYPTVVNILTGTAVAQTSGTQLVADGLYKFAMGGGAVPLQSLIIRAIKVVRVLATTGTSTITVQMVGGWGAS